MRPRKVHGLITMHARASLDKCTWGNWIRQFFKDIPTDKGNPTDKKEEPIIGPKYRKNLYLARFIAYFLSFFVLPGYAPGLPDGLQGLRCLCLQFGLLGETSSHSDLYFLGIYTIAWIACTRIWIALRGGTIFGHRLIKRMSK